MNLKLTKKDIENNIEGVKRSVGYCHLQHTLDVLESRHVAKRIGYASGIYGWNSDCFLITDDKGRSIVLTTGYRSLVGERIKKDACLFLERQAEKLKTKAIVDVLIKAIEK